jgi:hypothetical protein
MSQGPTTPSQPTIKRLFALSGNCCAFPKCPNALVDLASGSIVGEVCHIKGGKPDAPRYDADQSNEDRHGFGNLILLCNIHHKIVDDDETAYTVERLSQMKISHEALHVTGSIDAVISERFVAVVTGNKAGEGSVVTAVGQSGGQTAHSINNYYGSTDGEDAIQLDGKLESANDTGLIQTFGCPGARATVICRSMRPAKIQSAHLHVVGVNVMSGLQAGFGSDFGYNPVEGSPQILIVELIPLSPRNSNEGYVLQRDDVCRFFYPLPNPATMLVMRAKAEDVSIVVRYFDGTEKSVLSGSNVQDPIRDLYEMYHSNPVGVSVDNCISTCESPQRRFLRLICRVKRTRIM